jgi:hypothetical protein
MGPLSQFISPFLITGSPPETVKARKKKIKSMIEQDMQPKSRPQKPLERGGETRSLCQTRLIEENKASCSS